MPTPPEVAGRGDRQSRAAARRRRGVAVATALTMAATAGLGVGWFARGTYNAPASATTAGASAATGAVSASAARSAAPGTVGCPAPRKVTSMPGRRAVALTFDDGPSLDTTQRILAILAAKGVKATFFETGEHAAAHPELVKAVVDQGHAVGSHSWSHPRLTSLSATAVTDEVDRSTQAVSAAAGTRVCLMRPPFGLSDTRSDGIIAALGLTNVGWTHNPKDWLNPTPEQLRRDSAPWPGNPSTILLLHEHGREDPEQIGPSATVEALPHIIDDYRAAGYAFVQVDGKPFAAPAGGATRL